MNEVIMGSELMRSPEEAEPVPRPERDVQAVAPRWWAGAAAEDAGLPIDPDLDPRDPAEPSRQHHPGVRWPGRYAARVLVAVFAGGSLGSLARYALERALPTPAGAFPVATFVVNTSGALLIGVLMSVLAGRPAWSRRIRPFAGVGVLGGWTTMSTLAVEADLLGKAGALAAAAGYVSASLVAGVAAVALGMVVGRRWRAPAGGPPPVPGARTAPERPFVSAEAAGGSGTGAPGGGGEQLP